MKFTRIVRKIRGNFLTDKSMIEICYFTAAIDRVVIGDRDKIHRPLPKQLIEIPWISITVRKIESAKEPFLGARAEARVNMEIATAHAHNELDATAGSLFRNPVAIRCCRPVFDQPVGQAQDLLPYFRMTHIGGVDADASE